MGLRSENRARDLPAAALGRLNRLVWPCLTDARQGDALRRLLPFAFAEGSVEIHGPILVDTNKTKWNTNQWVDQNKPSQMDRWKRSCSHVHSGTHTVQQSGNAHKHTSPKLKHESHILKPYMHLWDTDMDSVYHPMDRNAVPATLSFTRSEPGRAE